ncbi:MAG: hypothetical protein QG671_2310 [Actinomycetota bacterium]|jgi:hypothetical protein|nr:hypothetical protein [Actinomycetota bacterium]
MADVLVRGLDESVIVELDRRAKELGLSRAELLRRTVEQAARSRTGSLSRADWDRFDKASQDLGDAEVMSRAWS